jgi:hypothetical protein
MGKFRMTFCSDKYLFSFLFFFVLFVRLGQKITVIIIIIIVLYFGCAILMRQVQKELQLKSKSVFFNQNQFSSQEKQ